MKTYKFIVVFTTYLFEEVYAMNKKEAKILAQAEQIKKGNSYNIDHIKWYKNSDNNYILLRG